MMSIKKVAKISKLAFLNGLRLHKDSILLYKNGSYPSAFQLSVIAQEELGKAYIAEEVVYQNVDGETGVNPEYVKIIIESIYSHRVKQGWFSRQADDVFKYRGKKYAKTIREISTGQLEENKQNATYVGLNKSNGKVNTNGQVISPVQRIKSKDAHFKITRVNDFIIDLIESVRRGVSMTDSTDLDEALTMDTVKELEILWTNKSKGVSKRLEKLRSLEIETDDD